MLDEIAKNQSSMAHTLLHRGVHFDSSPHKEMMIKYWGDDHELWIFSKHPDGQFVSIRKAVSKDLWPIMHLLRW